MAKINAALFEKVRNKTGLSRAALYERIKKKANTDFISNDVALLKIAAENSIGIQRYAAAEQLAMMRGAAKAAEESAPTTTRSAPRVSPPTASGSTKRASGKKKKTISKAASNSVFVVHGRDYKVRDAMFAFLRAVGLNPIEWDKAIELTGKASPHISEILDAAFAHAQAIVVLLTPDDEARLRTQFHSAHDDSWEKELRGQARPNVIFEAGLAFARNENGTVLVQVGDIRPFSDVAGRHVVKMSNTPQSRSQLITKLENAGCHPDRVGTDWMSAGEFTPTPEKPSVPLRVNGRTSSAERSRRPSAT